MEDKKEKSAPEYALVPFALMNDVLVYLSTKPHAEVDPYITAIKRDTKLIGKEDVIEKPIISADLPTKPEEIKQEDK